MPLSVGPVSVNPQLHPKSEAQREGRKHAFQLKLSQETVRAFKSSGPGGKGGQPPSDSVVQIRLDGDKPVSEHLLEALCSSLESLEAK
jgi:hypothetical protein